MKIIISGQTPSQKNNKIIGRNKYSGKTFFTSNQTVKDWQQVALKELQNLNLKFRPPVRIDYIFYVKDNTQRDLDNMITSVNDILQKAGAQIAVINGKQKVIKGSGIIAGDHWQVLKIGSADAKIDSNNPRAEVSISEIA